MFEKLLEIETVSIVFIGDFNPIILQPFWLESKGLIRESEAIKAKVEVMHNEIVKYELDDWVNIEITKNRCEFKTSKVPYFEPVKDLATSVFKILRETPIKALGINHIYDLKMQSEEKYFELGKILTPLDIWSKDLDNPRLLNLEIFEAERKDGEKGHIRIRINPSDQKIQYGVVVNVNSHFDLQSGDLMLSAVVQLEKNWLKSFEQSRNIVQNLLSKTGIL